MFDPNEEPSPVGEETAEEFQAVVPTDVRQAVDSRGAQAGRAKQDFQQAARGRVAFEGGANIRPETGERAPPRFGAQAV